MQTTTRQRLLALAAKAIVYGTSAALIAAVAAALGALSGCTVLSPLGDVGTERAGTPKATPALLEASCPPLGPLRRTDPDALTLRIAEIEQRYADCRRAALAPAAPAKRFGVAP